MPDTYLAQFRAASTCHAHLERIATKGSLVERYGVVLQELRIEVLRNNGYLASVSTPLAAGTSMSEDAPGQQQHLPGVGDGDVEFDTRLERGGQASSAPASINIVGGGGGLAGMAGWGQFDSLVSRRF